MWLSHPSFSDIMQDAWANPSSLSHAVSKFTDKAKVWNRNVFGNLLHRKKRTLARLRGVQIAFSNNPKNFLIHLKQELCTKLTKVLKLEEEFWAMKSQITWLVEGDKNTAFYHTSALVRQSRNRINSLKDNMGNWLNKESDIADFIRMGYIELFMSSHSSSFLSLWYPPYWNSCLKEDEVTKLAVPISDEEISSALWSLKAFKALGPDGLHAGFFQQFWLLVRESVREEVK